MPRRLPAVIWLFLCYLLTAIFNSSDNSSCDVFLHCSLFLSDMSQDSQHGKWTISSSDDDLEEDLPPSGTTAAESSQTAKSNSRSTSSASLLPVKAEPARTSDYSLSIGSEARQSAARNQLNPVKHETSPSLAGKRKKEVSDSTGWVLSDSDEDEEDVKKNGLGDPPKRALPKSVTKKAKVETERPPSPHGRLYYLDEPEDFFESSTPPLNDTYRFYLNKVTGLNRKFNSGALHIRGEFRWRKLNLNISSDALWCNNSHSSPLLRHSLPVIWHTERVCSGQ